MGGAVIEPGSVGAPAREGRAPRARWRDARAALAIVALTIATLTGSPSVAADGLPRIVAVKSPGAPNLFDAVIAGFSDTLQVAPKDVLTVPSSTDPDEVRRFVEQLEAKSPALVLTLGASATTLVHAQFPDVPVVYARVLTPIEAGGENLAGVRQRVSPRSEARLLARLAPALKRVAIAYDPNYSAKWEPDAAKAAIDAGFEVEGKEAQKPEEAAKALSSLSPPPAGADPGPGLDPAGLKPQALWVSYDRTWLLPDVWRLLLETARRGRMPLLVPLDELVERGEALASVYVDDKALGQRAAEVAKRILAGESPAKIGVVDPPESRVVNRVVAAQLGLALSPDILSSVRVVPP